MAAASALVGLGGRGFQLWRRSPRVGRVAQEVLEDLPLARALGAAERGRRLVGHVEADRVTGGHEGLGGGRGWGRRRTRRGRRFLFGEMKPPASAQTAAPSGVARYSRSAMPALVFLPSLRTTAASPPLTTGPCRCPRPGTGRTSRPRRSSCRTGPWRRRRRSRPRRPCRPWAWAEDLLTEPGKSVLQRALGRRRGAACPEELPSVVSALTTLGSVHGILWAASLSYFSGPAWER